MSALTNFKNCFERSGIQAKADSCLLVDSIVTINLDVELMVLNQNEYNSCMNGFDQPNSAELMVKLADLPIM